MKGSVAACLSLRKIAATVLKADPSIRLQPLEYDEFTGGVDAPNDRETEAAKLTHERGGFYGFVPDLFFSALSRIWGFGVVTYQEDMKLWTHFPPHPSPLQPLKSPQWLVFTHTDYAHWRIVQPMKESAQWTSSPLLGLKTMDDVVSTLARLESTVGAIIRARCRKDRSLSQEPMATREVDAAKSSYGDHDSATDEEQEVLASQSHGGIRQEEAVCLAGSSLDGEESESSMCDDGGGDELDSSMVKQGVPGVTEKGVTLSNYPRIEEDEDDDNCTRIPGRKGDNSDDEDADDDDGEGGDESAPERDAEEDGDSIVRGDGGNTDEEDVIYVYDDHDDDEHDGDEDEDGDEEDGDGGETTSKRGSSATPKKRRKARPKIRLVSVEGRHSVVGASKSPSGIMLAGDPSFEAEPAHMKAALSWFIGHFVEERPALMRQLARSLEIVCAACKKSIGNRADRLRKHVMSDSHQAVVAKHGPRTQTLLTTATAVAAPLPSTSITSAAPGTPSDGAFDVETTIVAGCLAGFGLNASQVECLTPPILRALLDAWKQPTRKDHKSLVGKAIEMLDQDVKDAVSPPDARVYLVVDGSSTSLANGRKVILVALILGTKTYLLQPTLLESSPSAEIYATTIKDHMKRYDFDAKKIVCIFTDGWSGNGKLARLLKLKNGQCQSHRFDLVAKELHTGLAINNMPPIFNGLMQLAWIREAFKKRGLSHCKFQTQDHRFKHLAVLFSEIAAKREAVIEALSEQTAPKKAKPKPVSKPALARGKRRASTGLESVAPAAKRSKEPDGTAAPTTGFTRQTLYDKDWDDLELALDFLQSGIDRVRVFIYNKIMAPLSEIIDSSEASASHAPRSFRSKVDAFIKIINGMNADPKGIVKYAVSLLKVTLDPQKISVPNGEACYDSDGNPTYKPALLDDEERLVNDVKRTLQLVMEKLPDRDADGKDAFTYTLCDLRDKADPRNGPPLLSDVTEMVAALNLDSSATLLEEVTNYTEWLNKKLKSYTSEQINKLDPFQVLEERRAAFPSLVPILYSMLSAPVTVASVERAFSMLHHMAGAKRRNRLGESATANELRCRFHRQDLVLMLKRESKGPRIHEPSLLTVVQEQMPRMHGDTVVKHKSPCKQLKVQTPLATPSSSSTRNKGPDKVQQTLFSFLGKTSNSSPK